MTTLRERIEIEVGEMQQIRERSQQFLQRLARNPDPIDRAALVSAIALSLHGFYTGAERIFEAIARQIDRYQPQGENWHRQLLDQMAVALPDLRPAAISAATHLLFDELRRFRHVVRSVYAYQLDAERVIELAHRSFANFPIFYQDIHRFCETLPPNL